MFLSTLKFSALALCVCISTAHADKPAAGKPAVDKQTAAKREADKQSINSACKSFAVQAGCKDMTMGKGLGQCLLKYKKAHLEAQAPPACKAALMKMRQDRPGGAGRNGPRKANPRPGNPPAPAANSKGG
ncbi:MAG: hypothetical protein ACXVA9_01650 [Bdellovibrionales bacterium]